MEDAYIIKGGKKIEGELTLSGAKNVSLKTIIAALLFDSKVILENVPRINDVLELIHLINMLGAQAKFIDKNTLEIDPSGLKSNKVDLLHASKTRVSFLLFAPLLHKFGLCFIPNPGGCRIGARPIDRVIDGMKVLGADIVYNHDTGYYEAKLPEKPRGNYTFNKSTHTGTELLILFSLFCKGKIRIGNSAFEPEIDELIKFLNNAGAKITREKDHIFIDGVSSLKQTKTFNIVPDANEAVTFSVLAVASGGKITITNPPMYFIGAFIDKLKKTGSLIEKGKGALRIANRGRIKEVNIEASPYPGFKTDWQPNWAVLMTQAKGQSTIHERVFENRFSYVSELKKLGANIEFINPKVSNPKEFYYFNWKEEERYEQMIRIGGDYPLHGGALTIEDLRAGATLVLAALLAKEESVINGASILERGYENFVEKISHLGGQIKKI